MDQQVNPLFWADKRVLLTGHTGFKGSWLSLWLQKMGATLRGVSLAPENNPCMFDIAQVEENIESHFVDIRDLPKLRAAVLDFEPDIIIHMAAQPLVRKSYVDPIETFQTNVMGTANVLEVARSCSNLKTIVNVTTDKCYENREWAWGYRENDPMGGFEPYSSSKGCAELLSSAYRNSFLAEAGIALATARAGNVIGGGDWSIDRLVPDILRSIENGDPIQIRNPSSIRPWQHVLEPLSGYLVLAERLTADNGQYFAQSWNFGPNDEDARSVEWIVNHVCDKWGEGATWTSQSGDHPHEANYLKLDISKARQELQWAPRWNLETAIEKTIDWHRAWIEQKNMHEISNQQIEAFLN